MLDEAFSRRMCCSRACRVSVKPRLPSASTVSPTMRPGMPRMNCFLAAMKPAHGPPKFMSMPRGWPSPTAMSQPDSPGERSRASETGFTLAIEIAHAAGDLRDRLEILDAPQEIRILHHDAESEFPGGHRGSPGGLGDRPPRGRSRSRA